MPTKKKATFEENLIQLEEIVRELEQGDVPLEKALEQFQTGIALSKECQAILTTAEESLTKMMTKTNEEVPFEQEKE